MALNKDDVEWVRSVIKEVLTQHIQSCPHGQQMAVGRAKLTGIIIGVGALCSAIGALAGLAVRFWPG